ncbi:MAG: hypothetical protein EOP48_25015 [Sphingobacteriales bacterium]|nr:MAG: hypothetical protein EOP48_25015 [Sphingobacteriales bacterium]
MICCTIPGFNEDTAGHYSGFQFICSLAVYPKLDWNLSLTLLAALGETWPEEKQEALFHYNTLLKISRIPWLQGPKLEQSLRIDLLNHLQTNTEIVARETIVKLLKYIQPDLPQQSLAYTELDVQLTLNGFFLFAHDEWKYKSYSYTKKVIPHYWEHLKEWALRERVEKQLSGIMPLNASGKPQTIKEYILKEKEIEVQHLRLSKAYVLTLPALLLYIVFSIFKPAFVYDYGFKRVSFWTVIEKDPSCLGRFKRLEISTEKLSSTDLAPSALRDTVLIKDINPGDSLTLQIAGEGGDYRNIQIASNYALVTIQVSCKE